MPMFAQRGVQAQVIEPFMSGVVRVRVVSESAPVVAALVRSGAVAARS
jgi:hypothetical protein